MGDQLKSLFDAIDSLGHSKKQNDKDEFQAEVLKRKLKKLIKTSTKTENDYQNVHTPSPLIFPIDPVGPWQTANRPEGDHSDNQAEQPGQGDPVYAVSGEDLIAGGGAEEDGDWEHEVQGRAH